MRRWKLFTAVAVVGAIGVLTVAQLALAVQPGDTVTFIITADSNQPDPPSGPHDGLVYNGGIVTMTDVTGCGTGSRPVQDATLVDPSGGESGRIEGLITLSETTPIPPGTRLTNLTNMGSCTIGGTTLYNRYTGTVSDRGN